jgi:hypothetical protein
LPCVYEYSAIGNPDDGASVAPQHARAGRFLAAARICYPIFVQTPMIFRAHAGYTHEGSRTTENPAMKTNDYTVSFTVDQSPDEVFAAINNVRGWWSGNPGVEGSTSKLGDEFTYRYEPHHVSKQKIIELIPGKKVVWRVVDGSINFVKDKTEWTGTTITFDIAKRGQKTEVRFTHVGLNPKIECFEGCSDAWGSYIKGSLRDLIVGGTR